MLIDKLEVDKVGFAVGSLKRESTATLRQQPKELDSANHSRGVSDIGYEATRGPNRSADVRNGIIL